MFKPLLRTLPSLSGNFTIACKLNEIYKDDVNDYHAYVRIADLMPLQNSIYKNSIKLNLLNGRYEHDIKKYFNKYSNVFYKENYTYNKDNYKILDLDATNNEYNDDRNKDYEFGCKRIYFSRTGYQFSFYAPFYIDDVNDLPEYFKISIEICGIQKNIKIYLNKKNKLNYLKRYIESYCEGIDNKVIFCLPDSSQATYFGVDVKNGGFVQYRDNIIGYLYNNQTTINNFDNTICNGFERNKLIMRQIIPISFMFNINELFNDNELEKFIGRSATIIGHYYTKNNMCYDMFDFDVDYFNPTDKFRKYNKRTGKYDMHIGSDEKGYINPMNVGYPSLNESKYVKYEFTNKITPNYCKFKLLLSDDNDPYITNASYGYSYMQYPIQKYGYFPTMLKGITPKLICINNDVKLPLGKNIDTYYYTAKYFANNVIINNVNYNKYLKLMQNYVSSWFNLYHDESMEELFENDKLWSNVILDYAYFGGVIYNLTKFKEYSINKFGVFLNCNLNQSKEDELYIAKYVYSDSDESNIVSYKYNNNYFTSKYNQYFNILYNSNFFTKNIINLSTSNQSYLHYDKVMVKDDHGKYAKDENYKNENLYYKLDDIIDVINRYKFESSERIKILEYLNANKILGYTVLDAVNNMNYFEKYYDVYNNESIRFMLYDSLFNTTNITPQYKWLYDKLYYSTSASTKKVKLSTAYNKIEYDEDAFGKFIVYMEDYFVDLSHILDIFTEISKEARIKYSIINLDPSNTNAVYIERINNCVSTIMYDQTVERYMFEQYGKINDVEVNNYFINANNIVNSKSIYVDTYNINNLNALLKSKTKDLNKLIKKEYFIKLINKDHIKEYYYKLNKDEDGIGIINNNMLKNLYVKSRKWLISTDIMKPIDSYVTLYDYILEYIISYKNSEETNIMNSIKILNDIMNSDNNTIYNWLYENLSETRNKNNKFELNINDNIIVEADLCIKKEVYKLENNLFDLLYSDNEIKNYLYLYIEDDLKNENNDIWDVVDYSYFSDSSIKRYKKDINEYLVPLFTDVYVNDANKETLFNMIQHKKIDNCEYVVSDYSCFKEIDIKETLLNIYQDKTYLIDDLYNEMRMLNNDFIATVDNAYWTKNNDNIIIDNKIIALLKSYPLYVYNTIVKNFKNLNNSQYSNINNNREFLNNIKNAPELITENEEISNSKSNIIKLKLCTAIKEVISNKQKQDELTNYFKSNNLYISYNEYLNQYLAEIKNNSKDANEANSKIEKLDYVKLKLDYLESISEEHLYQLIKNNNIILYSMKNELKISLDNEHNINEKNKLCIYDHNGTRYGYYFININIDNSNVSFNIANDYNLNVVFNSINGFDINETNTVKNLFSILYPFLKVNIFEEFVKLVKDVLLFPNELEISIKYTPAVYLTNNEILKYRNLITSSTDRLYYELTEFDKYRKLKLLRYFNYITPLIKKIDNGVLYNIWSLRFMKYDDEYNDVKKNNILSLKNINIYKYSPLNVYYDKYNSNENESTSYTFIKSCEVSQIEYKHFNDNLMFNLPETIELYDSEIYNNARIQTIKDDKEFLYNKKINILYNYFYKLGLDYDNIKLFLFNKYNSSFFIEANDNHSEYKIKYIFNLI